MAMEFGIVEKFVTIAVGILVVVALLNGLWPEVSSQTATLSNSTMPFASVIKLLGEYALPLAALVFFISMIAVRRGGG